jgi:hypothetical protein
MIANQSHGDGKFSGILSMTDSSKYHERLSDHYGRTGQDEATWPRPGIRVTYKPTMIAAVGRHGANVTLHGWRSFAMPVIEEALGDCSP